MPLVKVIRHGQVTLPAEARRALDIAEGDYLEAELVEGAVRLRPVAVVERERASDRLRRILGPIRHAGPGPEPAEDEVWRWWSRRSRPCAGAAMPGVVLDSSVLVSAFLTPHGTTARLLLAGVDGAFRLCLSEAIVRETARVLLRGGRIRKACPYDDAKVAELLAEVTAKAGPLLPLAGLPAVRVLARDPDDDPIIATVLAARADFLVTGDQDLLTLP